MGITSSESPPFGYDLDQGIHQLADMPLLVDFVDRHRNGRPLEGVTALFIQHQLGNQVPMAQALIELGLDPREIFWLDVPYTASSRVRNHLIDHCGIPADNFWVHRYRVLDPYRPYQRRRAQELVRNMLALRPQKVIVLDDGAYFIEAAAAFRDRLPMVAVVEQTTRGFIRIASSAALRQYVATIPVVNVAGSIPKLDLESPWIGVAVVAALDHHLTAVAKEREEYRHDRGTRALVLGYGAIGRQVARFLRGRFEVWVSDTDSSREQEARGAEFRIWDRNDFDTRFGLVVGCTGRQSFGVGDYVFLDDRAILASASSGSVEFSRRDFIDLAATSQIDDIWIDTRDLHEDQIHRALFIQLVDRQAAFLNGGFPINFDGRTTCVPTRYIQPTAVLMVQGALQAVRAKTTGCIQLEDDFCHWLDGAFRDILSPEEANLLTSRTARHRACWNG